MKKLKKIILILVIIIFIIIVCMISIKFCKKDNKIQEVEDIGDKLYVDTEIQAINDINMYAIIENIVDTYVDYNSSNENEKIINMLDNKYVKDNNITADNVRDKIKEIKGSPLVVINDITQQNISNNKTIYYVSYDLVKDKSLAEKDGLRYESSYNANEETTIGKNCDITISVNSEQKVFSIIPNKMEQSDFSIEKNEYNTYEYNVLNTQKQVEMYIQDFTNNLKYKLEESYNKLDEEYRNKRFGNLEKYQKYMNENQKNFEDFELTKYKEENKDDYTEYICIDQYGNYYIFKDKGVMNYTVMLDTYTIDSDEFNNKYNNGSEQIKVGMNLEKIFQALNRKDYQYIYEKLDNNFKQNYFSTEDKFEEYAKSTFFDINKITYGTFEKQSGMYIYNITISDANEIIDDNQDNEEIETNNISKKFIIKLEDNKNFKLAFNVN